MENMTTIKKDAIYRHFNGILVIVTDVYFNKNNECIVKFKTISGANTTELELSEFNKTFSEYRGK